MKIAGRMTRGNGWPSIGPSFLFFIPAPLKAWLPLALLLCLFAPSRSVAQVWDGGGADNFWSSATNWNSNATPTNNGTATLVFAGTTRLAPYADVNWSLLSIIFSFLINFQDYLLLCYQEIKKWNRI